MPLAHPPLETGHMVTWRGEQDSHPHLGQPGVQRDQRMGGHMDRSAVLPGGKKLTTAPDQSRIRVLTQVSQAEVPLNTHTRPHYTGTSYSQPCC